MQPRAVSARAGAERVRGLLRAVDLGALVVAVLVAGVAIYGLWIWHHWSGDPTAVSDVVPIPFGLAAAGLAWRASSRRALDRRTRSAWRWLAAALLAWALGDLAWCWLEVVRESDPFPSVADAFYLSFYVLAFVGLLRFPVTPRGRADRVTLWLDTATVMVGTVLVVGYLVVGPTLQGNTDPVLSLVFSLAYPAGDVILVYGIARVLLRRPATGTAQALRAMAVGMGILAIADIIYARQDLTGAYQPGSLADLLWVSALTTCAIAAELQWRAGAVDRVVERGDHGEAHVSKLPYAVVVGAFALLIIEGPLKGNELSALILGVAALTALVVARQLAVLRENERLVRELDRIAGTDLLTGLANRRRFFDLGERVLQRANGAEQSCALLMLDIDHFKEVNDRFGHATGDSVIQRVGALASEALRPGDLLARLGGDEFVVLLPATDSVVATQVARRLRSRVAADFAADEPGPAVTVSIGVAERRGDAELDHLVAAADVALYDAKRTGRDRVVAHA